MVKYTSDRPWRKTSRAAVLRMMAIALSVQFAYAAVPESLTLNGTSYTATESGTINSLVVTTGTTGNGIVVPSGLTLTVVDYSGAGALAKTGDGTLVLCNVDPTANIVVGAGHVLFDRSTGVESMTGSAAMHLDASKASSVATSVSGNDTVVDRWYDVRDTPSSSTYAYMKYPDWGKRAPVRAGYQNGLSVIDTLAAKTDNGQTAYFNIANMQGTDATGTESYVYGAPGIKDIWEVFMVVEDNPGTVSGTSVYQSFLTDQGNDWRKYWERGANGAYWASSGDQSAGARSGKTWLDGVEVSTPTTTPFPSSGMHLLRVQRNAAGRFKGLSQDRARLYGGLKYGEVIAFRSALDDVTAARITARLTHKWFGRQRADEVEIGAGGRVQVAAGETLSVDSLTLAHLDATVGSQPLCPTTVTLASAGNVSLTVPSGMRIRTDQEITLLEAENDIVGAANVANWTISCNIARKLVLKADGRRLYAQVASIGLFLVVK